MREEGWRREKLDPAIDYGKKLVRYNGLSRSANGAWRAVVERIARELADNSSP